MFQIKRSLYEELNGKTKHKLSFSTLNFKNGKNENCFDGKGLHENVLIITAGGQR